MTPPEQVEAPKTSERELRLEGMERAGIEAYVRASRIAEGVGNAGVKIPVDVNVLATKLLDKIMAIDDEYPLIQKLESTITPGNDNHGMNGDYNVPAAA